MITNATLNSQDAKDQAAVLGCLTRNKGRCHDAIEIGVALGVSQVAVQGALAALIKGGKVRQTRWPHYELPVYETV